MQVQLETRKTPVTVLAAAIALGLSMSPSTGYAQQSAQPAQAGAESAPAESAPAESAPLEDAKNLDAVVVTGFRASLQQALDIKREEVGVVDAIVAEDIADFPDLNLAESLQRIPGVSIARDAGEGRQISVRGLGPDFTRVRINGMEALTTAGGTDSSGGANRGRGFDFNVFASELFNSLKVRKTASADVEEGSLGATVDLQTARPFDYDGLTFVAGGQLGFNDLSKDIDPRATALISNTWADGRFGALLSVAYTDRRLVEEGHSTVRWDNGPSSGGFAASSPFAAARLPGTFHPRIPRYGVMEHDQQRLGITSALQFKLSDKTEFGLDLLYAKFDATRTENFLNGISFSRTGTGKPQTVVLDGEVDARGNLVYGRFNNVDVRSEARYDELSTKFSQANFYGEHKFSDDFAVSGQIGRAKSEFDNPIQTTITLDRSNAQGYVYDYRDSSRLPIIDNGFDVNDPAAWSFANGVSEIRLRPQASENTFDNRQLDFRWTIAPGFKLKGGIQSKKYQFDSSEMRRVSELAVPSLPAGTRLADLTRSVALQGTSVGGANDSRWLIPDIGAFDRLFDIYSNSGTFALSPDVASARGNNRSVEEKDLGYYLQTDFSTNLGEIPISGNFGVRHVKTKQSSTGFALAGTTPVLTTVEREYNDTLPSLNLVADITPDFLIRFGAAKVMSRPGLANLTPGVTVSVSGGNRVVAGGNPLLDPFRAKTYDLGLEWYFAEEALLGVGFFYKNIDSFVQTSREIRPYNSSGLPNELLAGTGALPTDEFQFNIPVNTPGGKLRGVEFSYQQPFSFLPGFWNDFGVQFNYTYVDSKIQYVTAAGASALKTDLVGLSKNAYNATLYYEGERFSARVSAAYRDDYLTTVPGRNNADVEGTKGTTTIDMSASWKINDKLELTLEGLNLTDEYNDQWVDSLADRVSVYHHTGRQYFLGLRFKL
ncbi:tonB-dependent receptor family protein [Lysobacter antibioticus]|uniref:TonB-dependent receptor n=1 Tax=Lysobacter antibioticus TaxID=84531 RepID=UPI0007174749|nr:TonB-dependent receptor [Lysobacter antibioticus]ALN63862.1 tonB-dependent receptor family protein [Lysobacter antibioticus]